MSEHSRTPASPEELARSLIASARLDERPVPEAVRHRMLAALGAAAAVGTTSAVAGAASGALHRLALLKWFTATALVATAGVGVYAAVSPGRNTTTDATHVREAAPAGKQGPRAPVAALPPTEPSAEAPPVPETQESDVSSPGPAPQHRRASTATSAEASSLEGEVAALDGARAALASGSPPRTLQLLDAYERAFPKGVLRPEASYLRIQALSKSGQHGAARELAARYLARFPKSPHASQLKALISQ